MVFTSTLTVASFVPNDFLRVGLRDILRSKSNSQVFALCPRAPHLAMQGQQAKIALT